MSQAVEKDKIEEIVQQFRAAWKGDDGPSIDDYLPFHGAQRLPLMTELVQEDLKQRLQAGNSGIRVETYLERYPELAGDRSVVLDLLALEFEQRRHSDPDVSLAEYQHRFPQLDEEQLRQLEQTAVSTSGDSRKTAVRDFGLPVTCMDSGESKEPATVLESDLKAQPGTVPDILSDMPRTACMDVAPTLVDEVSAAPLPHVAGYELLGVLGRGGMGVVYKARHEKLKRLVALKMVLAGAHAGEQELVRFRAEAEAVARVQHPNIVQIYEVNEQDGHPYFSLEFVDGGSLAHKLRGQPLSAPQAAHLIETLARAMHFAHVRGIVHRDLKPANILLMSDGTPKITDFGLAKQLDSEKGQTRTGAVMGTPNYMAPEQARGQVRMIGPATDVYALGAILYELLTASPPFIGETAMDVMIHVTNDDPLPPSRLQPCPRDLETICLKCLEKDPHRRYPSAEALAEDLRRFTAHEPILARPAGLGERTFKWLHRHPATSTVLAACLLAALAAGGVFVKQQQDKRRHLGAARSEIQALILRAEEAGKNQAWLNARELLVNAREKLEAEPALQDMVQEAQTPLAQVEGRLAAMETLQRFHHLRDAAIFHATLASGESMGDNGKKSQESARAALDLVRGGQVDDSFTDDEKPTIRQGCYELLLVLAEIVSQMPGRNTEDAAGQALHYLAEASRLRIETKAYHLRRARYCKQCGDQGEADKEAGFAREKIPQTALDHYLVGDELYKQGDSAKAEESFRSALRLQPDHFWARYFLALCYIRQGKPDLARDNLTACLSQKEDMIWVYLMRGFAQGQLAKYDAAEADFDKAFALESKERNADAKYVLYNNRAVMRIGQKKFDEANRDLKAAIDCKPKQYQAYATLSQAYFLQEEVAEAIRWLDQAIDIAQQGKLDGSTLALLYRTRSRFHVKQGKLETALADLRQAADRKDAAPNTLSRTYADIGRLEQKLNQHEAAVQDFDNSLRLSDVNPDICLWRADSLFKLERYDEAIQGYDAFLKKGGKATVQFYQARAKAKAKSSGSNRAALDDLTLALELMPRNKTLLNARAQIYLSMQAYQLAQHDFEELLRIDPVDGEALVGRGYAQVKLGGRADAVAGAVADANQAVRLDPHLAYQAARIFAQAVGKIDADAARQNHDLLTTRSRYQQRAVELIRQALALQSVGNRVSYWHDTIAADVELAPIRRSPEFAHFDRLYPLPVDPSKKESGPNSRKAR